MQSKISSNRNSSNGNKSFNSNHQIESIKRHNPNKLNGNNIYASNHMNANLNYNSNHSSNHLQQNRQGNGHPPTQHSNVILINPYHQPITPYTLGTSMISPYITTQMHPHQTPPTTAVLQPYLTYQTPNGLITNHPVVSMTPHGYVALSNAQGQHSRHLSQMTNNKNYQSFRMPNSPPVSSTTASGSSSQGSSGSSTGSNSASNSYHSVSTNNSSLGSQQHTTHSTVISGSNNNLNSLSNGKLNSKIPSSASNNLNQQPSNTNSSTPSNSTNNLVNNSNDANLMVSTNGTVTSNSSVVSQTNSTSTNGNHNASNNNNQNGSTPIDRNSINNNESTNGSYGEQLSRTNFYIRGLSPNTTDKNLFELCSPFGKIVSTKAIIDKATNNCKGYGFVDFDSPFAAEDAVKQLQLQGIEAQMAKRTDWNKKASSNNHNMNPSELNDSNYSDYNLNSKLSQQEQDPTNLYIANLPITMTETDLDSMLNPFGNVISTRILKDMNQQPRGVGFARMESKEKCDLIIQNFNNKLLVGSKEPLLVKFADGGKKKNQYKNSQSGDSRMGSGQNSVRGWRETNGNASGNGNSDQLSPYNYTPNSVQDHHSHPIVAHAVAAHHAVQGHAVENSGHQAVATVHQMLSFPHSLMQTQSIDQSLMNQQLHLSNFNPGIFKSPAYHPHHPHRNPTYSSAQPVNAPGGYAPGAPHHYQILPGTHLQNSQQQLAMDPNTASHFMPGLAAQMQQLQIGGHSYIAGNPAYGNASQGHIYTTQAGTPLMQQMPLSENTDNHPNSTNSSVGPLDNEIGQQSYNPVYSK